MKLREMPAETRSDSAAALSEYIPKGRYLNRVNLPPAETGAGPVPDAAKLFRVAIRCTSKSRYVFLARATRRNRDPGEGLNGTFRLPS